MVLGTVDLDELADKNLSEVSDWEDNFRAVKAKGRDAEKLPSTIKVDCITVSTEPVKATIDDHIQRLFDALLSSLRRVSRGILSVLTLCQGVNGHIQDIDKFVESGMEALSTRPQTVEEIGKVNAQHSELSKQKPTIQPLFEAAETKNRLLRSVLVRETARSLIHGIRSVAGGGVDLASVQSRWDKFELMLESHALMIKEQACRHILSSSR